MKFAWRPNQDLFHPVSINHLGHKTKMFVLIIIFLWAKHLYNGIFSSMLNIWNTNIYIQHFRKKTSSRYVYSFQVLQKLKKMKFQWNVHVFNPKIIIFWLNNISCISFTHKIRIDMIVFVHTCKYNLPSSFSI